MSYQIENDDSKNISDIQNDDNFNSSLAHNTMEIGPLKAFTLNSVFDQIGGFGKFQVLTLIIFAFIRNFGSYPLYLFGLSVEPQEYVCAFAVDDQEFNLEPCSIEHICLH